LSIPNEFQELLTKISGELEKNIILSYLKEKNVDTIVEIANKFLKGMNDHEIR